MRIPVRYVLVEAAGGLLSLALVETMVLPMPAAETTLLYAGSLYVLWFALAMGLIAAAFIDLEFMFIPDVISIGAIILGLATWWVRPAPSLMEAALAAAAGFVFVWLVFGVLYKWLRGRTGMGLGDAKLLAVAGAWFGFRGLVFALFAAAVQGTAATLVVLLLKGRVDVPNAVVKERALLMAEVAAIEDPTERASAQAELDKDPVFERNNSGVGGTPIPFGPFLALAIIEYLLVGDILAERYFAWSQG